MVIVDFWATRCIPCHAQAEVLKTVFAALGENEGQVLAEGGETETQLRGFVERKLFPYPMLLDPGWSPNSPTRSASTRCPP